MKRSTLLIMCFLVGLIAIISFSFVEEGYNYLDNKYSNSKVSSSNVIMHFNVVGCEVKGEELGDCSFDNVSGNLELDFYNSIKNCTVINGTCTISGEVFYDIPQYFVTFTSDKYAKSGKVIAFTEDYNIPEKYRGYYLINV